jgi:hypothetical protein
VPTTPDLTTALPSFSENQKAVAIETSDHQPLHILPDDYVEARLLMLYFQEISKWFEMSDSQRSFSANFNRLVISSRLLRSAAITLASKYRDSQRDHRYPVTQSLYQYVTNELSSQDRAFEENQANFITHMILCAFSMMSSDMETARTRLGECAAILELSSWSTLSDGFPPVLFWVFARMGQYCPQILRRWLTDQRYGLLL